jgi:hypothetical protein
MPRCTRCGAFNPVHLKKCDRCGELLVPLPPVNGQPQNIKSVDISRSSRKSGPGLRMLLIFIVIVTSTILIYYGYVLTIPESPPESPEDLYVPENLNPATLNITIVSQLDMKFHVLVAIDGNDLVETDVGPDGGVGLGSYNYAAGTGTFLDVCAFFYDDDGNLRYVGHQYLWAFSDRYYEITLHPDIITS